MKNLLYIFLGLVMILNLGCSGWLDEPLPLEEKEEGPTIICENDHAEFHLNGTLIETMHMPDQGEILTANGESCGIGAGLSLSQNSMTMRIFGENYNIGIGMNTTILNEEQGFRFLSFKQNDVVTSFDNLAIDDQNSILIEELDMVTNIIKGKFNFQIENSAGEIIKVTDGSFSCSFFSF